MVKQQEFIQLQVTQDMDIFNQLRNSQLSVNASSSQGGTQSIMEGQEVINNELYLQEMAVVDRNWEIPRNRLIMSTEKLGGGEFGVVNKGVYIRTDGHELPVAVKRLKGLPLRSNAILEELFKREEL